MLLRHVIIRQSTVLHNNLAKIRNKNDLGAINSKKWEYDECTWSACASVTKKRADECPLSVEYRFTYLAISKSLQSELGQL